MSQHIGNLVHVPGIYSHLSSRTYDFEVVLGSAAGVCAHDALLDVIVGVIVLLILALHQQQLTRHEAAVRPCYAHKITHVVKLHGVNPAAAEAPSLRRFNKISNTNTRGSNFTAAILLLPCPAETSAGTSLD
jgi:hypothetical protein